MTYQESDEDSTSTANHLVNLVKQGEIAGILSEGLLQGTLGVVSVIKADAVCDPIDVALPLVRVWNTIQGAKIRFCLIPTRRYERDLHLQQLNTLIIDEFLRVQPPSPLRLQTVQGAKSTAYVVFTSGSTHIPEEVRVSHVGVLSLLRHPPARLYFGPGRRIAETFSVGFDGCIAEIFGSLIYGATLVLKDPTDPFAHLRGADAVMATPSLLAI
jgi:gliotoxin/aspirochlorine biosynthesis peptide synthetase